MNLSDEERRNLRVLVDVLHQLNAEAKRPTKLTRGELHGGFAFLAPLIAILATGARAIIPLVARAAPAILRAAPTAIRALTGVAGRALPVAVRGVQSAAQSAIRATQGRLITAAQRSGALRGPITTGARGTTRGLSTQAPTTTRGLLSKVGSLTAATAGTGVIGSTLADDTYVDEFGNEVPDDGVGTGRTYQDYRELLTKDQGDQGGEDEAGEDEEAFNLAPLRFQSRVRNVFTAAPSRNPQNVSTTPTLYSTTAPPVSTRVRDIGVFRGSGITHRKRVLKRYKLEDRGYSLDELAAITGVSRKTLQEVYNRGIGAYKTNPRSVRMKETFKKNVDAPMSKKLSKEQWAMARVWSFLNGNPKHDGDLRG